MSAKSPCNRRRIVSRPENLSADQNPSGGKIVESILLSAFFPDESLQLLTDFFGVGIDQRLKV